MTFRFRNSNESIYSFGDHFLVECPRCGECAGVRPQPRGHDAERATLFCASCGYSKEWQRQSRRSLMKRPWAPKLDKVGLLLVGSPVDWHFHLPLWLRTGCCGDELWAYNSRHLAALQAYVEATLREREGTANGSWASRLPRWMKIARNRQELQRCIKRLHASLKPSGDRRGVALKVHRAIRDPDPPRRASD